MKDKPITPDQFIAFVQLVDHDPAKAVSCLKPQAWPDFRQVSKRAEDLADKLDPSDTNIVMHAWLFELSLWCRKRIR